MYINNHFLGILNILSESPLQQIPHSFFHFCVSHCVNDRINMGQDCKEHSHPLVHRVNGHRTCVGEYTRTIREHHYYKAGATCREDFLPSFRAMGFQGIQESYVGGD